MVELAKQQPGFLGFESVRDAAGLGVTISYWDSVENIQKWRQHSEHQMAQDQGKTKFYKNYKIRIAQVVRDYEF
jgi:heme-degrading monooxygenase HmoA